MAESSDNKKNMRDFLRIVFRNRLRFLLGSALVAIVVLQVAHYNWPLKYTGLTKFQRRTDVAGQGGKGGTTESFENIKLTLEHDLMGRNAVALVAEELKLFEGLPRDADGELTRVGVMAKQEIVAKLRRDIQITWEVKTRDVDLVAVRVRHADRRLARDIPDLLVTNYINKISQQIVARLTASRDFLLKRVNDCNLRLMELNKQRLDFETLHADAMPDDPGALQERIRKIEANIETLRISEDTARSKLQRLLGLLNAPTSRPSGRVTTQPVMMTVKRPNPEWQRLDGKVRELRESLAAQRIGKTAKHPTIIALQDQIKLLEKRISTVEKEVDVEVPVPTVAPRDIPRNTIALQAQIAAAKSELEIATQEKTRLEKDLKPLLKLSKNFAPIRQEYTAIIDKIKKEEQELNTWRSRYTGVQMDLAAEVAKRRTPLSAVQAAEEQDKPSSPSLALVLGLAVVGGLGVGAGLVFLASVLNRTVNTVEDAVQRFQVPVHGVISEIVSRRRQLTRRLRRWLLMPTVATVTLIVLAASVLSVCLWLRSPTKYKGWQNDPMGFVRKSASDLRDKIPGLD